MTEYGAATGLPLDLPLGKHPFDWYLHTLRAVLGERKAAMYLGLHYCAPDETWPPITTVPDRPEYL